LQQGQITAIIWWSNRGRSLWRRVCLDKG